MKNFQLFRPTTTEAAVGLLGNAWGATELLAGGTDERVGGHQRLRHGSPQLVVSVQLLERSHSR